MDQPKNLMTVNCIMMLADELDMATLVKVITDRLLIVPRFRQSLYSAGVWPFGRYRWFESEDFDLGRHLIEVNLDEPGSTVEFRAFLSGEMSRPFDPRYPLWRLFLVHGYEGRSVLFWQLQHSIGDGVALMVLLLSLMELGPPSEEVHNPLNDLFSLPEIDPEVARRHLEAVLPEATRLMVKPAQALARTRPLLLWIGGLLSFIRLTFLSPDRRSVFKRPMSGIKRVAWSRAISLESIQKHRMELGGTVTDVLMTAVAGAFRRYVIQRGETPQDLRVLVPVSLRPIEEMRDLGNRFGLVFLRLPISISDPVARLAELRRRMRRLKGSLQPLVTMVALGVLGRSPRWFQRLVLWIFGLKGTVVVSSVPGPTQPLFFGGQSVEDLVFWVPQSAGLNVGLSILTYDGKVTVGLMSDAAALDTPQTVIDAFDEELVAMGIDS